MRMVAAVSADGIPVQMTAYQVSPRALALAVAK